VCSSDLKQRIVEWQITRDLVNPVLP